MIRARAVLTLLAETAGLPAPTTDSPPQEVLEDLARARRRALATSLAFAAALAVLVVAAIRGTGAVPVPEGSEVFALAALVVAAAAGFRLGQYQRLRTLERMARELLSRYGED